MAPRPLIVIDLDHTLIHAVSPEEYPAHRFVAERVVHVEVGEHAFHVFVREGATALLELLSAGGAEVRLATQNLYGLSIVARVARECGAIWARVPVAVPLPRAPT